LPGVGIHEIVIESPRHLTSVAQLSDAEFAEVIGVYGERLTALRRAGRFTGAVLFKNSGAGGGATLAHLHSQLVAVAADQPIFADRMPAFRELAKQSGNCPLCAAARDQSTDGHSLVLRSEHFLAFCPFASRFAYEMWVAPREHLPRFEETSPEILPELAQLLRAVLVKLEATVKSSAYNYIIHTAPFDTPGTNHYHWHIEILPRLSHLAGFELGTGCFINTVSPERAAAALRDALN
jgi:UDPglucose--hexose-1-phosphate uridylyltransferase